MKTRNFLTAVIFVVMFFIFSGCSDTRNNDNYSFWKQENQLRFFISIPKLGQYNNESLINEIGDLELPEEYQKRVDKLKKAMISYFKEEYKIDISSKIENQKLRVFYSKGVVETTMGYVDPQKPETLNLNQILFTEFMELFDNTYVHETLHQIGFRSKKISIIDEGVTDALTDLILQKAKIESVTTDIYYEARMLAYQLIKADKDLIKFYLENDSFQIQDRINEKLSKVSRPFEDRDPGIFLDKMLLNLIM